MTDKRADTATGKDLDDIAEMFGVPPRGMVDGAFQRRVGVLNGVPWEESDAELRDRIMASISASRMPCTRGGIIAQLATRFPRVPIGIREVHVSPAIIAPKTLWQRIRQVWRGPQLGSGDRYVEVAVVVADPESPEAQRLVRDVDEFMHDIMAAGMGRRVYAYEWSGK
jgi:hypothetical protein